MKFYEWIKLREEATLKAGSMPAGKEDPSLKGPADQVRQAMASAVQKGQDPVKAGQDAAINSGVGVKDLPKIMPEVGRDTTAGMKKKMKNK